MKRQLLIKETKKIEHEMKLIIISHNNNNYKNKYNINKLPYLIYDFLVKYLLAIPNDVFQQHILQYLAIKDIGWLDSAITNHNDRSRYLNKIANSII